MIKINEPEQDGLFAEGTQEAILKTGVWELADKGHEGDRLIVLSEGPRNPIFFGVYPDGSPYPFVKNWTGKLRFLGPIEEVEITIKQD